MYTQAFCDDSLTAVFDSAAVNNRSHFASEFSDRLDGVQPTGDADLLRPNQRHRRHLQQHQQQRSMSSPAADDAQRTHQRRASSQDRDADLSPADIDDNDSMQVQRLPYLV